MTAIIDSKTTVLVLRCIANGKRAFETATLSGVDLDTVRRIARENGYPDMGQVGRSIEELTNGEKLIKEALVPADTPALEDLGDPATVNRRILDKAMRSPKANTRKLAARIDLMLADLMRRLHDEAAVAEEAVARELQKEKARAQIAQLEAKLAEVRAVLNGKSPAVASTAEPTAKMIRAWAAQNAVRCSTRGRVEQRARDAYLAAHTAAAA
ncbi:Lsr2 family DNA-binding protein [Jatrophihabitans sp. DSM 45814]